MARTFGSIQFELSHFAKANDLPSVDLELLKAWINEAYHNILDARQWKGLETRATLQTVSTYRTGTVAATNGSAAIAGTGTTFTAAMTGRKFRIAGSLEVYTFTYASATGATLDRPFEGATITGASYEIFANVYSLPSRVKHIVLMRNTRLGVPMEPISEVNLDQASASRLSIGEPYYWCPAEDTADSTPPVLHQVEIYPAPETAIGLPYTYIKLPIEFDGTNNATEILPWVDPRSIVAGAKTLILAHLKNYEGAAAEMAIRKSSRDTMSRVETDRTGPSRIKMASRYTAHRRRRGQWGAV